MQDLDVGVSAADGVAVTVRDGLAHVRSIVPGLNGEPGRIDLWASAPAFEVVVTGDSNSDSEWIVTVSNCMPDAVLTADPTLGLGVDSTVERGVLGSTLGVTELDGPRPTVRRWHVDLSQTASAQTASAQTASAQTASAPTASASTASARGAAKPVVAPEVIGGGETILRIAPPDAHLAAPDEVWRFAVMGDIQGALPEVHQVFERINLDPTLRFVASTGDLVQSGATDEYELLEQQFENLAIPYYSTIGNHELISDHARWRERFGRFNVHFRFKGAAFSLVDSGDAGLDPLVYDWLDTWLADAADDVHIFFTHIPPLDPVGVRAGSFRSSHEAHKLLNRLAKGKVDLTLYGHIHSYYSFSNAGIPAYISGGGGAIPELWDGIGRHFLIVSVAADRVDNVAVVRVD